MRVDDWLDEAIAEQAAGPDGRLDDEDDWLVTVASRLERISRRGERIREKPLPEARVSFEAAIERLEKRLIRVEAGAAQAFESIAEIFERESAAPDPERAPPENGAKLAVEKLKAAVSQIAIRRHELSARPRPDTAASSGAPEAAAGEPEREARAARASTDETPAEAVGARCAVDLGALRHEIAAMNRSLADLAPRNAIVAIEGAIGDLARRIDAMRQTGQGELVLAPLEAMAAELKAAVKARDPEAIAAGLEREIHAIGVKIDGLAASAMPQEAFDIIRRQTEEVRDLLASAASRTAPLERMERQIGELADRVERLGASPEPHFESAQMTAELAEARRRIENSTPPEALLSIERRLDEIATRLDEEIARLSAPPALDSRPFDDLAQRIEAMRQAIEERPAPEINASVFDDLGRRVDEMRRALDERREPEIGAGALADLGARIDGLRQSLEGREPAKLEASVLDDLGRRIDDMRHSLEDRATPQIDERMIDDLARRIDDMRRSLEDRAQAPLDMSPLEKLMRDVDAKLDAAGQGGQDARALQSMLAEISGKLDRLSSPEAQANWLKPLLSELSQRLQEIAVPVDLGPVERLLQTLGAKIEAGAQPLGAEAGEQLAEDVAQRLKPIMGGPVDAQALAGQIVTIYDRLEALAGKSDRVTEAVEKLGAAESAPRPSASDVSAAIHSALSAHLSELRAEHASADRRTQSRLEGLQSVLEALAGRLAGIESELAGDVDDELQPPPRAVNTKTGEDASLPGIEALGPEVAPPAHGRGGAGGRRGHARRRGLPARARRGRAPAGARRPRSRAGDRPTHQSLGRRAHRRRPPRGTGGACGNRRREWRGRPE